MAQASTGRRAALLGIATFGALAAAPALAIASKAAPRSSAEWERALAAFKAAELALKSYQRDHLDPAAEQYEKIRTRWPMRTALADLPPEARAEIVAASAAYDPIQDRFDELVSAQTNAVFALIYTPAPSIKALADKMRIATADEAHAYADYENLAAAMIADAYRLARQEER